MSSPLKVTRRKALVIADWMLDTHDGVREYHEKITLCERLVIQPKAPPPPEPPGPLMQLAETLYNYRMAKRGPACLITGLRAE